MCPRKLSEIVSLFESVSDIERRDLLNRFAENSLEYAPEKDIDYDIIDMRKDPECSDAIGVFLKLLPDNGVRFAVFLGPKSQTLTRSLASILCRGFEGESLTAILQTPRTVIEQIVGTEFVRLRSRTVFYMLDRMQRAASRLCSEESFSTEL